MTDQDGIKKEVRHYWLRMAEFYTEIGIVLLIGFAFYCMPAGVGC